MAPAAAAEPPLLLLNCTAAPSELHYGREDYAVFRKTLVLV
jgi:hypothetical protein